MRGQTQKADTTADPPYPLPGFETSLIRQIERLVADLPPDTAQLHISRILGHPEWAEPYFEVVPANHGAARLRGVTIGRDLNLTIGEAASREFVGFARGGTLVRGLTWQEEFSRIWLAVITGGFTERIYRDSQGKTIGGATKLSLDGRDLTIRNGRRAERLFGRERLQEITYVPYF